MLRLFAVSHTPAITDTMSTYAAIEASFPGYAPAAIQRAIGTNTWSAPSLNGGLIDPINANARASYGAKISWLVNGTQAIYGHFWTTPTSNVGLLAEQWASPLFAVAGSVISLRPNLELGGTRTSLAWRHVQSSGATTTAAYSLSATFPGAVSEGNLIIVGLGNDTNGGTFTVTDNINNTPYSQAVLSGGAVASGTAIILWFIVPSGGGGYPFTVTLNSQYLTYPAMSIDEYMFPTNTIVTVGATGTGESFGSTAEISSGTINTLEVESDVKPGSPLRLESLYQILTETAPSLPTVGATMCYSIVKAWNAANQVITPSIGFTERYSIPWQSGIANGWFSEDLVNAVGLIDTSVALNPASQWVMSSAIFQTSGWFHVQGSGATTSTLDPQDILNPTLKATFPGPVTAGNLIIVGLGNDVNGGTFSVVDNINGHPYEVAGSGGTGGTAIILWYIVPTGGGGYPFTISLSSQYATYPVMSIDEYVIPAGYSVVVDSFGWNEGTNDTATLETSVGVTGLDLLYSICKAWNAEPQSIMVPPGFETRYDAPWKDIPRLNGLIAADGINRNRSMIPTFSLSTPSNWVMGAAAFKASTEVQTGTQIGVNVDGGNALFANMVNGGTRNTWWVPGNTNVNVSTDSNYWPQADATILLGEGDATTQSGGSYLVQFTGSATVTNWPQVVDWWVNGVDLQSSTLQAGQGYDSVSNTTTATMVVPPGTNIGFYLTFTGTSRNPNIPGNVGNGITNLYVMQPTTLGGNTPSPVGTLFTPSALGMLSQYTVLRFMDLNSTNGNLTSNWADRNLVSYNFWTAYAFGDGVGVNSGVTTSAPAGVPWEIQIALVNATGTDAYICIPSNVSPAYITNLANLFAYGSDGINAYTSPQGNPIWRPLNANHKLYIEFSNETWNSGFVQAETRGNGWANQLSQRAVYDYLTNNQNDPLYPGGGANAYNDGAILAAYHGINSGNDTGFLGTYNPSPAPSTDGGSPGYFGNWDTFNGYNIGQSWIGLRDVQISNAFKTTFGEIAVNANNPNSRVRPLFEWQYGGGWSGALGFIASTYGAQHPVGYYLYGGGGGWYADNHANGFTDISFSNPAFADGLNGWTVSGSAGVVPNGSGMGNPTAPPLFSAIAIVNGAVESGTTVTITTVIPHAFVLGQSVNISGVVVDTYNGTFTITGVTPTTFTYEHTTSGIASSGGGMATGTNSSQNVACLQPGASISQNVIFSGSYANITLYATQTVPFDYYHGLSVVLTPLDGGPVVNNGQSLPVSEGNFLYSGNQNAYLWNRSQAFYTGSGTHTYSVTFASTLSSGVIFLANLGIQTVNGMFNETTTDRWALRLNISSNIQSDIGLALNYGLHLVGYEGGYNFNQNQSGYNDINAYQDIGTRGWSSSIPNVGLYANLDSRTLPFALETLHEYFAAGGILPIVYQSIGNLNSWAVAGPTYFDWNTPKHQAVVTTEQTPQVPTYGLHPGQGATSTSWWLAPYPEWGSSISAIFIVVSGTYTIDITFGGNGSAPEGQTDAVNVYVDGQVIDTIDVIVKDGGTFSVSAGTLFTGQYLVQLINVADSGNAWISLGAPGTSIYTLTQH